MIRLIVIALGLLANSAAAQGLSAVRMTEVCGVTLGVDHPVEDSSVAAGEPVAALEASEAAVPRDASDLKADGAAGAFAPHSALMIVRTVVVPVAAPPITRIAVDGSEPSADFCP